MRDTTEAQDPDSRSVRMIVADLPQEVAFGFTTPEGERVCIVDSRAEKRRRNARETAFKTFWGLLGS